MSPATPQNLCAQDVRVQSRGPHVRVTFPPELSHGFYLERDAAADLARRLGDAAAACLRPATNHRPSERTDPTDRTEGVNV